MSDKYLLNLGCHRNTITSRDSEVSEYETEEAAIREAKKFYHSIGYVVWFAEITRLDGSKTMLEQNSCRY